MWDEEMFALSWIETKDVYQDLDPLFIEEKKMEKLSIKTKGKVVIENDKHAAVDDNDDDDDNTQ